MARRKTLPVMSDAVSRTVADLERLLDEALGETFPASDPISTVLRRPQVNELSVEPRPRQNLPNGARGGIAETAKIAEEPANTVDKRPIDPMWKTALSLLIQTKERLDNANDAEKAFLQMEYDDALAAYLAVADEL